MLEGLTVEELRERAIEEGSKVLNSGALLVDTSPHTGRSANAKFYVWEGESSLHLDWTKNAQFSMIAFQGILRAFQERKKSEDKRVYRTVARAVRDTRRSINVEFYTEKAVHALFVKNMFSPPTEGDEVGFSVYHFPSLFSDPIVLISLKEKIVLISGTEYSGEIKKSIFSVLNYLFPEKDELPMHCSANASMDGKNLAVFFGLSGTGKTTLSSDQKRVLIGDDEHCWTSDGITNFEGGCYAKTFMLNQEDEPQIWEACHGDLTLLENVTENGGVANFDSNSISENGRASYPFHYISNASESGFIDRHPDNVIMLTCDAFGVLPPVSKLTPEEAYEHFLLGYTAKVAGTEVGVKEPIATFSPCFGGPFMPRKPEVYAALLKKKVEEHKTQCWLVNTGWTGGPYGIGKRISILETRKIIDAILDGSLAKCKTAVHEHTGLTIPRTSKVNRKILYPEKSWSSLESYQESVSNLKALFSKQGSNVLS